MPIKFASTEARRQYWRDRYWKHRDEVLAKRRAKYQANDPETNRAKNHASYLRNRDQLLNQQRKRRAADPDKKHATDRRNYRLRNYGTENPLPGQLSLDGTKHFMNAPMVRFPAPPPKPRPTNGKTKSTASRTPNHRQALGRIPVPRRVLERRGMVSPATPPAPVQRVKSAPAPKRDPWIPQAISRWEPGLDRVAS